MHLIAIGNSNQQYGFLWFWQPCPQPSSVLYTLIIPQAYNVIYFLDACISLGFNRRPRETAAAAAAMMNPLKPSPRQLDIRKDSLPETLARPKPCTCLKP